MQGLWSSPTFLENIAQKRQTVIIWLAVLTHLPTEQSRWLTQDAR